MKAGHNGIAGDQLKAFVERIERLTEEKAAIAEDIKEVFAEAKGTGFDPAVMRALIKERKANKDDLDEFNTVLELYRDALGQLASTPLGEAAVRAAQ